MSRIPGLKCPDFLDPFLSPWRNSQSFSSFSWNRILLFYPVCTVCTRDCWEIGRQAIRCSSQNLYSPQLLFDKAKQSLSIGQNWDTKPSTRAEQFYTLNLNNSTLSLNNSTLSLNSSTLSLNNSMLSLNSSTLSLNSSTLSLNSSTLSLNSSTLSLSSSPLSYDSSTLSLFSSPLSYDSFSAERGSLQTDIMLTEQSHNF